MNINKVNLLDYKGDAGRSRRWDPSFSSFRERWLLSKEEEEEEEEEECAGRRRWLEERVKGKREERLEALQAFVHFSRFVRVAKWVGLIALNREGSPSAPRSHARVCMGCAEVLRGDCGESRALPRHPPPLVVCRLLCVKTAGYSRGSAEIGS